jgi:hypothetical protein
MTAREWLEYLENRLSERNDRITLYSAYYDGDHRLAFATSKFKEAFGELFGAFATNWCGLVVDVACERLQVQGFRFGEDEADDEAWGIWQANQMDARSLMAHTEAVKNETSYLLVGPPKTPGGEPVISVESPFQVIVEHDPADQRIRLAAMKKWQGQDGRLYAQVYTDATVTTFSRDLFVDKVQALGLILPQTKGGDWQPVKEDPNPLEVVPVIPLDNCASLGTGGRSDLAPAVSLNDAANKFFTDMIHASEFTSFPQRVLTGVEIPRDPITKEPLADVEVKAAVSRLWAFEGEDAKVFQLQQGDLGAYVEGVDLAVQHLAAQTRTPPHYLLAKLANISGDALIAAETGLVARCRRKHLDFSDPHEEAMRLAFKWRAIDRAGWIGSGEDMARSEMDDAETIWSDPENKDPVSLSQSLTMKQAIGVPQEVLWEEAGYTPQQIKRMRKLRDEELKKQQELLEAQGLDPNAAPALTVAPEGNQLAVGGLPGPVVDEAAKAKAAAQGK